MPCPMLKNALTRNGGSIYNICSSYRREYILYNYTPFLVSGFQAFQLVQLWKIIKEKILSSL